MDQLLPARRERLLLSSIGGMHMGLVRLRSLSCTVALMEGSTATEWLSTAHAAQSLGVQTRTLYKLIDQGEIPGYRMGRVIRLRIHEVDAFIDATRIQPGSLSSGRKKMLTSDLGLDDEQTFV